MHKKKLNVVPEWIRKEIKKGFVADALLANWDVIDELFNNILITNTSNVIRTNIRSIFNFRAQGNNKTFSSEAKEIEIMRNSNQAKMAKSFFHDITNEEINIQINNIENGKNYAALEKILPHEFFIIVAKRMAYIQERMKRHQKEMMKIRQTLSKQQVTEEKQEVLVQTSLIQGEAFDPSLFTGYGTAGQETARRMQKAAKSHLLVISYSQKSFTVLNSSNISKETITNIFKEQEYKSWEPRVLVKTDRSGNKMVGLHPI